MPKVAGKGYPYTKKGQADAKKAAEKYSKRGKRGKKHRDRDSKQETSNQSYKMKIKPKY